MRARPGFIAITTAVLLFSFVSRVSALSPERLLGQLQHTAWAIQDGAPPDIWAITQSADGYLWLGTGAGLYRFDGLHFEKYQPPSGQSFPLTNISALAAFPGDEIWIGYHDGGTSLLKNGRLTNFDLGPQSRLTMQFARDLDGAVWIASYSGLARYTHGRWQSIGTEWGLPRTPPSSGPKLWGVAVTRSGTVWVSVLGGDDPVYNQNSALYFLPRGAVRFTKSPFSTRANTALATDRDGRLWIADNYGVRTVSESFDGNSPPIDIPIAQAEISQVAYIRPQSLLIDRGNAVWGMLTRRGLFRIDHPMSNVGATPQIEHYAVQEGLTSDNAASFFEDREGNVWVGTSLGLNRFRAGSIVAEHGMPDPAIYFASKNPNDTQTELYILTQNAISRVTPALIPEIVYRSPANTVGLVAARDGSIWIDTVAGLSHLSGKTVSRVPLPAGVTSDAMAAAEEDSTGALWASFWGQDLPFRISNNAWSQIRLDTAHRKFLPFLLKSDEIGGMWLYERKGDLLYVRNGRVRSFNEASGLQVGTVATVDTATSHVLVGGDHGLAEFDGTRFRTLSSTRYPVLSGITGVVRTERGESWIFGMAGVVRARTRDLEDAFGGRALSYTLLDFRDGLPGLAQQNTFLPKIIESADHRLWFLTSQGVAWTDPAHLIRNEIPPSVFVKSLIVGDQRYSPDRDIKLPSGTSNLRIEFAAISLTIPERNRAMYKLDGVDSAWVDAGSTRQASYTNLAPRTYHFSVRAANNDGVWNASNASLTFIVPPTFLQSNMFLGLCVVAAAGTLWLLYSFRLQRLNILYRNRLEERLAERERIARELHDTLLQGFHGLVLRFQSAANHLPADAPARALLEKSLERADQVLVEGRDRVRNLRAGVGTPDLSQTFVETAKDLTHESSPKFKVTVEGAEYSLHPVVLEEIVAIGREAIVNALRHARAGNIDVALIYRKASFSLRVVDDGDGIDPGSHEQRQREGHFGLTGMRERCEKIGGDFKLSTRPKSGTELVVTVPLNIARAERHPFVFRRRTAGADAEG